MKLEQVAQMMGICQFDLFRQAYAAWHRSQPNDEVVAEEFMNYAADGVVPVWVSFYAKTIVENCKVAPPLREVA